MEWRMMKGNPRYRVSDEGDIIDTKRNRELRPFFSQTTQKWMVDILTQGGHNQMPIARIILEAFAEKGEKVNTQRIIYKDGNVNNYHLSNLTYKPHRSYEEALAYQREYYYRKKAEQEEQQKQRPTPLTSEEVKELKADKYRERVHQMYKDWTEALEERITTEELTPFQFWCVTSTIEANKKILQKYGQDTNKDR